MGGLCFRTPPALIGVPSLPIAAVNADVRTPHHHHSPAQASALGRNGAAAGAAMETAGAPAGSRHSYAYARPLRRLWPGGGERIRNEDLQGLAGREEKEEGEEGEWGDEQEEEEAAARVERRRRAGNWVLKILRARSAWPAEEGMRGAGSGGDEETCVGDGEDGDRMSREVDRCIGCCGADDGDGCHVGGDEGEVMGMDKDAFTRLLRRVSLKEARLFAQLSYLGKIAYAVPRIKPANLLKYHGLCFVTSSLEMKRKLPNVEKVDSSAQDQPVQQRKDKEGYGKGETQQKNGRLITAAAAYQIAASAASYVHSRTRSILPLRSARSELGLDLTGAVSGEEDESFTNSEVASFVATTNSVTAVVAAKEETKEAVAKDLNSANSSPCEWFICDDDSCGTRFLVIQGSDSLASWQANLLFEPIQFEGLDVIVHRGIYEAAKGIYQQMLPHVRYHLKSHGNSATFRFTGHSLGGSLSLLVSLMLLIRGEVPPSSLLPVVTFGSPYIMCGGDYLLRKLGLPLNYVQAIMMHRDIVPRAFSCSYPDHVAEILKAVNGKFRNHPCLKHQSLLYAPMGQLLILQPEEKFSPHHELLPPGTALYVLGHKSLNFNDSTRILRLAQSMFLNTPHPLEMLSDRAAYGSEGTVSRDHDMNAYLRSLRGVVCQKLKLIRKAKRGHRRKMWCPLVAPRGINESIVMGRQTQGPESSRPQHLGFSIVFRGGVQSLRRLGRLVASRHMHMLALLLPTKMFLLGVFTVTSFS